MDLNNNINYDLLVSRFPQFSEIIKKRLQAGDDFWQIDADLVEIAGTSFDKHVNIYPLCSAKVLK